MRQLRPIHLLSVVFVCGIFAALAALPGCNEEVTGKRRPRNEGGEETFTKVAIVPKGYGTITGKVTYEGPQITAAPIQMGANEGVCHLGAPPEETKDESWIVGPNNGLKNVMVIIQPGDGKFFQIPKDQLTEKDVTLEQPRCAFIPRVYSLFCKYWDGTTSQYVDTPNKLIIHNNAAFDHNFNMLESSSGENKGRNFTMRRDDIKALTGFNPETKPITAKCDIHSWMRCYGFMLDHPYASKGTAADGTFTIENAPLGEDVQVVVWHEAAGFFGEGGQKGKKMNLKDKQELTFTLKR